MNLFGLSFELFIALIYAVDFMMNEDGRSKNQLNMKTITKPQIKLDPGKNKKKLHKKDNNIHLQRSKITI